MGERLMVLLPCKVGTFLSHNVYNTQFSLLTQQSQEYYKEKSTSQSDDKEKSV